MNIGRIIRHLTIPAWAARRVISKKSLAAIAEAVRRSESQHRGQIRVVIEGTLDLGELWQGMTPRARAENIFARYRVWDTEANNGVLLYLLLADRSVEIVADRGVHGRVGTGGWTDICRRMEEFFHAGQFERGVIAGIEAISKILISEYPASGPGSNELPDEPAMIR